MIDQQTLLQILQSLHQRNAQPDAGVNGPSPISPAALGMQDMSAKQGGGQPKQQSMIGYLGGLMDDKSAYGPPNPSALTQANNFVTGLPQQANGMLGGIGNFLASLF